MHPSSGAAQPTRILMAEHEVIEQALDCLDHVADAASIGLLDLVSAEQLLDFFEVFLDRCHHHKEEECLFPRLVERGLPRGVGPIAVMLSEHEEGRRAVTRMRGALAAYEQGELAACGRFVEAARVYTEHLRAHIEKENYVLFPMAEGMLDEDALRAVLEGFGRIETHDVRVGSHEGYLKEIENLVMRLGVKPRDLARVRTGACCGHGPAPAASRADARGA